MVELKPLLLNNEKILVIEKQTEGSSGLLFKETKGKGMTKNKIYDFLIVGGGSAGCVLTID